MIIQINRKIYIKNPDPRLAGKLKRVLSIPNSLYHLMKRKNPRACYAIPKEFKFYSESEDILGIGRGNMRMLLEYCKGLKCDIKYQERLVSDKLSSPFKTDTLELRDYQVGVPEKIMKHKNGIIKLSVGFGKSLISLKLIELSQLKTLIIVPRTSILNQFKQEIKKYYNYDCGVIQGTTWNIKEITVASISTLQKRDLSEIKTMFGMVIVDEGQLFMSDKRLDIIQSFNPERLYTTTGTPARSDDLTNAIFFTFGDIIIERELPQVPPVVEIVDSGVDIPVEEYADMVANQISNVDRNDLIINIAVDAVSTGNKIIILTKRVFHFQTIEDRLKLIDPELKVFSVSSEDKQKERDDLLEKLRDNTMDFDIILGTYSMLATGVNIVALNMIILAGDLKSEVIQQQAIGRCQRLLEGKLNPVVVDISDMANPIFRRQAFNRHKLYKKMGWEIV